MTVSSFSFAFAFLVLSLTLPRGVTSESGCRLILSRTNQSLAIRVGSTGELTCQISPECNLTGKIGPFWKRPNGDWFEPSLRVDEVFLNSTSISLRYALINWKDLGIYICMARVEGKIHSIAANISERQVKQGDVDVTIGPEGSTRSPQRKKRFAEFIAGLMRAAPPKSNRRIIYRSLQDPRSPNRGKTPLADTPATSDHRFRPVSTPCEDEKLFSKTGIIIVAGLACSTFLLLYMVILLMAVPRICFPYYPKKKTTKSDERSSAEAGKNKEGSSARVDIPLTHKVRHNGRSDSGIESVDGLEDKGSHHGGGRTESHWEIGADKLEEFYRRTTNQNAGSDEDMLSGLKIYNMERNIPRRGRSESVPVTPYRYQSSIYVKV